MIDAEKRATLPRLVVLISGVGTTLKNLLEKIAAGKLRAEIVAVVSSKADAGGLSYSREAGIPSFVYEARDYSTRAAFSKVIFDAARRYRAELVIMGGFLRQVDIPTDFQHRVLNIHPSLIPLHSGHGFYGLKVHASVLAAGDKESGCTVHFVDNQYDHGPQILQRRVPVLASDTIDTLAARVFEAECEAYPEAIRRILKRE